MQPINVGYVGILSLSRSLSMSLSDDIALGLTMTTYDNGCR